MINGNTQSGEISPKKRGASVVFGAVALLSLYMGAGFLASILMGAVFATVAEPFYLRLLKRRWSPVQAAGVITLLGFLVLLIPLGLFILVGVKAAIDQIPAMLSYMETHDDGSGWTSLPFLSHMHDFLNQYVTVDIRDFQQHVRDAVKSVGGNVAEFFATMATQIPGASIQILFSVLSFVFFLLSGQDVAKLVYRHTPFTTEKTRILIDHFQNICSALIISTVAVGFLQSIVFTIGCAIARMPNLPLIGLGTFVLSFVPAVGSSPLYIGMILYAFVVGQWWQVVVIAIFAALVALSDNTVRPLLLRSGAHMHPIIALTSVLAGIRAFGFSGIFLGPILMTMLFQIYSAAFETTDSLARTEATPSGEKSKMDEQ